MMTLGIVSVASNEGQINSRIEAVLGMIGESGEG